ncbi:hypothetical protein SNE40_006619 [Patella caerulea]|uniref:EF-hand domain-containing protein n=1 Tax=Patella caerulea TaxID=87958 RepID=A0AAN8JW33_PATCE
MNLISFNFHVYRVLVPYQNYVLYLSATSSPKLANVSTLMDLAAAFDLVDLDDDGVLEYADDRDSFVRADTNGDGELSQAEMDGDSVYGNMTSVTVNVYDFNGDGKVTVADYDLGYFEVGREYGNDVALGEYVEYFISKTESEESGITVKAFVTARRNFLVMDIDDNLKVSEKEFRSEFRVADYDKNGNLTPKEFSGFRPIRDVNVTAYCNNGNVGCPVEKFLVMFNDADTNNDKYLTMTEYLTKFGELTANT